MKNLLFTLLFFSAVFPLTHAQDVKVTWGKPFEPEKYEGVMGIMETSINGRVYGVTGHVHLGSVIGSAYASNYTLGFVEPKIKMDYYLFKTTAELTGIEKKVLISADEDLVSQYINSVSIGDQVCVFIAEYNKKLKSTDIICKVYDESLNLKKSIDKIFTLTGNTETTVSLSPDKKKLVVLSQSETTNKDQNMQINAILYDENLAQIWKKKIPYEVNGAATGQYQVTVDNNGVMNFIVKQYNSNKVKEAIKQEGKSTVNYKYLLYRNAAQTGDVKIIELKYDNLFITDIKSFVSDENILTCFALLSDKPLLNAYASLSSTNPSGMATTQMKSGGNSVGYGLFTVAADGTISYAKYDFTADDIKKITAYMTDNEKPKDETRTTISNGYEIRDMYTLKDGSRMVTLEYFMPVNVKMEHQDYINYRVYDILVMKISTDGKLEFINSIPKRVAFNDVYFYEGHLSLLDDKGLHFIFIDTPQNTYKSESTSKDKLMKFKEGHMYVVDLNTDNGTYKKRDIGSIDHLDILINTGASTKIDNHSLFLVGLMSSAFGKIEHYNFGTMQ